MRIRPSVLVAANAHRDNELFRVGDPAAHLGQLERFERWLHAARRARASAPEAILRILDGADLVGVTAEDAAAIKAWAGGLDGWQGAGDVDRPLLFLPASPSPIPSSV